MSRNARTDVTGISDHPPGRVEMYFSTVTPTLIFQLNAMQCLCSCAYFTKHGVLLKLENICTCLYSS